MVVPGAGHPIGAYLSLLEAWQDDTSLPSELGIAMALALAKVSRGAICHFPASTPFAMFHFLCCADPSVLAHQPVLPSDQDGSSHLCCTRNLRKKNIWALFSTAA